MRGYTEHSRLISFDRRGAGLSDPVEVPATLEEQMADVTAVLDACSSDRVVLEAQAEAAMLAVVFAATHPERVSHLILMHPMARMTAAPGYEWGWADEETRERDFVRPMLARWGTGENGVDASPIMSATDPSFKEWWGRMGAALIVAGDDGEADEADREDGRPRDPAARPGSYR